ncbi:MAG: 23S rRNA (uracil(1939)-C(5))-methyltransferase RlmD [Chlamydiales bacterium]|nr:23S rRNA (uracil(1939)-C(5))-methyltransferase RlmD [Chlamydiales bacterium]
MTFCEDLIEARCRHFGTCGGCKMQNVPYDQQIERKEEMVRALFPDHTVHSIIGCDDAWEWRNKMEYTFSQTKAGERYLGLMMRGKRRVVQLEECHLTPSWFVETLQAVYAWWEESGLDAYFPPADLGCLRTLTLRDGAQQMAVLTISGFLEHDQKQSLVETLSHLDSVILRRQVIQKKVPTRFEEEVLWGTPYILAELDKFLFRIRPDTFFQPNTAQAEVLYGLIRDEVEGEVLLDLYCGSGSIGIFCASKVKRVIGVEVVPGAEENIKLNGISNMEVQIGTVESLAESLPHADTVVVDPPRAGLGPKVVKWLNEQKFKKVIYVSCNPKSQAKDIASLEYSVESLQPVDQFPHTPHVENIALLTPLMI